SRVRRYPFASSICRTAPGTELSVKGPMLSTLPVCAAHSSDHTRIGLMANHAAVFRPPCVLFISPNPSSAGESTYKCAALAVKVPGHTQPRPMVGIGQGHGRHGMSQLGQWGIKRHFISAEMVLTADGAGLHGGKAAGPEHRGPVVLRIHD